MARSKAAKAAAAALAVAVQGKLGLRIQALRAQREITQEVLAARAGISQKYVSELERGTKSPSWQTLVAIAHKGFEVRLAALMFGIDEELGGDVRALDDVLAGRSLEARTDLMRAFDLVLRAGATSAGDQVKRLADAPK